MTGRRFERFSVAIVTAAVVALLMTLQGGAAEPMPEAILGPANQGANVLYWVSARAAVTSTGELDWSRMDAADQLRLSRYVAEVNAWKARNTGARTEHDVQSQASSPSDGAVRCPTYFASPRSIGPPQDLASAVSQSVAILRGEVVATSVGFSRWLPGVLLQVRTVEVIKSDGGLSLAPDFFVFYPIASFTAGGLPFCSVEDELPPAPHVGDTVLVLPPFPPRDRDRTFVVAYPERFFVQEKGGRLARPPISARSVVPDGISDVEGLAAAVRKLVAPAGG